MKKYSLSDSDISTIKSVDSKQIRPSYWSKASSVVMALAVGSALLTGCSDEKSCTDRDQNADPYVYDTGSFADPYDYGGDSDAGSADPVGAGDACRDFD